MDKNTRRLNISMACLCVLVIISILSYQLIAIDMKYFSYVQSIRIPKLLAILIASFCIGSASIVFQSIINNRIVTPCLLGMNALYILVHTVIYTVFGSASILVYNQNISFLVGLVLMGFMSTILYSYLFKKTNYNILYVLLTGTVLATLFSSISNSLITVMDPNEFTALQSKIIASFDSVNSSIIGLAIALIIIIAFLFRKEIALLDVTSLGKKQAINLGVDYDKTITRLLLGVTLYIAIATALVGPISFLGLIIANVSRQLFKTYKHTYLMLGSVLFGMLILLLGQIVIEHLLSYGANISVFINTLGGIYFLYLILTTKGS